MKPHAIKSAAPADAPPGGATVTVLRPAGVTTALLPLPVERPAFNWVTPLVADTGAAANARLRTRPQLTICRWPGSIDAAARVAARLVDNAARHGKPFSDGTVVLRLLAHPDTDELLVEVDDALPDFPGFAQAAKPSREPRPVPPGLWWVSHYGGTLAWDLLKDDGVACGKTVQAILPARWEDGV
ncbi:hypothetical protein [Streptomyces sp. NPDC000983]|uniref:hypothetical protein n=1 Tax=Streptomyces sp. NPDC000983 TaxID=3154373 RepID=UPI0033313262